jgi:hypothetical protein
VASTIPPRATKCSATEAAPSTRCSQLSSTTTVGAEESWSETAVREFSPAGSTIPRAAATVRATASLSAPAGRDARSTKADGSSANARMASRVLPTPPGPTKVTNRYCRSAAPTLSSSASRPMNDVSGSRGQRNWFTSTRELCAAWSASARRSARPSFRSREETWLSTVRSEMNNRLAISALLRCSPTSRRTSASRGDGPSSMRFIVAHAAANGRQFTEP